MKSILKSTLTIIAVLALSIGATSAYFNDAVVSAENVFTSGTVDVNLSQLMQPDYDEFVPGYTHSYNFTVANPGSLPIHVKGYFDGAWSDEGLSTDVISFESLEYRQDGQWISLGDGSLSVGEEFEYRDTLGNLYELAPTEAVEFRVTFTFAEDAGNEFQGAGFSTELHVAAKQAQNGSDWPAEY